MRKVWMAGALAAAGLLGTLAPSAVAAPASCPTGWVVEAAPVGDLFDNNGDGLICTKLLTNGNGNSANTQRGDGQTGYHVDGHNHKDNNV